MVAGLQKLNIQTNKSSAKAAIANNLRAQSSATSATSYGIFARRTAIGTGLIFNNKAYNSDTIMSIRHLMNNNRAIMLANQPPHKCNNSSGNSTMNKFAAAMMATNMLTQMTAQTMEAVKDMKGTSKTTGTGKKKDTNTTNNTNNTDTNLVNSNVSSSLQDLTKQVETANKKVATFSDNYSNTKGISDVNTSITDIKALLQSAGVRDVNIPDITISSLIFTANSSLDELDNGLETIQNTDIASVDTLSGSLGEAISKIDNQLRILNSDTNNAATNTEKIRQLQSAKSKLETLREVQLPELKSNLTKQKDNLTTIRKEKATSMDKLYNQAQTDDKQIGTNNENLQNLQTKIQQETNDKKKKKLIKQYNNLAASNKVLQTNLQKLGNDIQNSNGDKLSLTNLSKAIVDNYQDQSSTSAVAQNLRRPTLNNALFSNDDGTSLA
jgi:hypothetical protein